MTTPALHQQPTPERFFNAVNAYELTEAMKGCRRAGNLHRHW